MSKYKKRFKKKYVPLGGSKNPIGWCVYHKRTISKAQEKGKQCRAKNCRYFRKIIKKSQGENTMKRIDVIRKLSSAGLATWIYTNALPYGLDKDVEDVAAWLDEEIDSEANELKRISQETRRFK